MLWRTIKNGYSRLEDTSLTQEEEEIQDKIDNKLDEVKEELEDNYSIILDIQYSWDYKEME